MTVSPVVMCILDGYGINPELRGNAVQAACTPHLDSLFADCPNTTLTTHGELVGLPGGQMGNSEVGHLNIGAGRVVEQWLLRISRALENKLVIDDPVFRKFCDNSRDATTLHVTGLFSPGGVHSHSEHLKALIPLLREQTDGKIIVHLITDGRDTGPETGIECVKDLENFVGEIQDCQIGSVIGRFYAMDRDKRWERTEKAVALLCQREGSRASSASEWLARSYEQGITDEFVEPAVIGDWSRNDSDAIVFYNFRADRMRQLVSALCLTGFAPFPRSYVPFRKDRTLCFTAYDETYDLPFLFNALTINNHLGEVVSKAGLAQLRIAETEKYPHVTYFLNGGIEEPYSGEIREMVPSPRDVKTYDLKPEMSAYQVKDLVEAAIRELKFSLIVVNFANCDMVGHSGVMDATVKAVETVDECVGNIIEALKDVNGSALIFADHGNAEQMINYETGEPHTAHTTFPVPCILFGKENVKLRDGGALSDIAPTILALLGLKKPVEMTGESLLIG